MIIGSSFLKDKIHQWMVVHINQSKQSCSQLVRNLPESCTEILERDGSRSTRNTNRVGQKTMQLVCPESCRDFWVKVCIISCCIFFFFSQAKRNTNSQTHLIYQLFLSQYLNSTKSNCTLLGQLILLNCWWLLHWCFSSLSKIPGD